MHDTRELSARRDELAQYKQRLIENINRLNKIANEAPTELNIPRESLTGILRSLTELINVADLPTVDAERRMRIELNDALVPLGYFVAQRPIQ